MKSGSNLIILHVVMQLSGHHLLRRLTILSSIHVSPFSLLIFSLYLSFDLPLSLPTSYLADLYSVHIFVDLYLLSIVLTFNLSSCDSSIPYGRGNDGICVWPGEGNQPNAETLWKESGITCQLKALIERQRGFGAGVGVKSRIGLSFLKPN